MGSSQSVPSTSEITYASDHASNVKEYKASTKNGPKTQPMEQTNQISIISENEDSDFSVVSAESDYSSDEDEDFDSDDDEDEAERRMILEEARQLKEMAGFFLRPEAPVASDPTACARCYFSRYSAPTASEGELEDEMERKLILADAKNLKELADFYLHPEKPVVSTDATACGRNFFTRPSAPEYEDDEDDIDEERELILEEMKQLKTTAGWYMHPEKPVAVDSTACGRNFFTRPSAPISEDEEERELILEEMKQLKTTAGWYMHPEKPVAVDSTACGRNFFTRPSAPISEDEEERELILEEMKQLKTTAGWYMHPEKPVAVDSTACGRNFFARPSAPEYEDEDGMDEERELILEEMKQLKTTAEWYMHPEKSISVDPTACGRNYFNRPSAPVNEEEEERELILQEMKALKTTSEWYFNPEKPVAVDASACGRNYFSRPSAPVMDEDMEERERILEDTKQLKMTAEWYMHPDKPVAVDSTACGRNYYSRPAAMDDDAGACSWETSSGKHLSLDFESNYTDEMEEERKRVLADANQLKEVASWYLEPEKPVKVDPTLYGRNYFSRPSAPEQEDESDTQEREQILADLDELKKVADWYMHPEKKVTVFATACGRNFFTRPSAPEYEDEEDADEREQILADAAELLQVAKWYMHPEKPVTVYATATGRNFFSRPSAHVSDDEEEKNKILAEAKELKKVAGWYLNPEQPVKSDGFASGRNYFTRPSAPEYDDEELEEERDQVLAEAKELKKVAGWYLHPERPVESDGFAAARNYFTRPSAPEHEGEDCEQVIAETKELKKLATDYLHPENPVAPSSVNCARNYFDRPSAKGHAEQIHTQGFANHHSIQGDYVHDGYDYLHHHHHDEHFHHDDVSHQSFHSQSDHFEMDEDAFHGFRDSMHAFHDSVVAVHDPEHIPMIKEEGDGKEGNLSRSPSSIMLFDEQAAV